MFFLAISRIFCNQNPSAASRANQNAAADGSPEYLRPGDSFETRPAVFRDAGGGPLADPVWVDLLTGRVYDFPRENVIVSAGVVRYLDVPVYDSPCVLTERAALDAMK